MNRTLIMAAASVAALLPGAFAQGPDGSDINKAIPIYFGQIVSDIGDVKLSPLRIYSITVAKGQQLSIAMKSPQNNVAVTVFPSTKTTVGSCAWTCTPSGYVASDYSTGSAVSVNYLVPTAGIYYIQATFGSTGEQYTLQVTATGTPILVPNPQTAGCLSGQVDSITYSLQLIAAQLPDEVSIGGQKACASCTVKAPLYPEIADRLEKALGNKLSVDACYDSSGNIFQIKLRQ